MSTVGKLYLSDGDREKAVSIAEKLRIVIVEELPEDELVLELSREGLALRRGALSMMGDFSDMLSRIVPGRLQGELLVKSAKLKNCDHIPTALDATAGMAQDSLLLAAAGFKVKLYEKDSIIAALLADALERGAAVPELSEAISRMELYNEDSIEAMKSMTEAVDVIYLDPMFPARSKSGLIKKKFQLLQQLEAPCSDEAELMEAAMSAKPSKLVVKRPLKGPYLGGVKPSYSHQGKAIRYDAYVNL